MLEVSKEFIENVSKMKGEPGWLKEYRAKSFEYFSSNPFETNQLFTKYTTFSNELDFNNKEFNYDYLFESEVNQKINLKSCIITTSSGIKKLNGDLGNLIFTDLISAINEYDITKEIILNSSIEDKMEGFTNSMFNCGVFIYVPKYTIVSMPLRNIFLVDKPKASFINKTIIYVDEGSQLNFVEEIYSTSNNCLYTEHLEVFVQNEASLNLIFIQALDKETNSFVNRKVHVKGKASTLSLNLGGDNTRYRLECFLKDLDSELDAEELFFGDSSQHLDMFSKLMHLSQASSGRLISKSILMDKSSAFFKGIIKILTEAKNSQSYLADHSLMLSKDSKHISIPSLEIETDSVKATHSSSSQQIDSDQIFYLTSKGFSEEDAKKAIVFGFAESFLKKLPSKSLRNFAEGMLEEKWLGKKINVKLEEFSDFFVSSVKSKDIFEGHYKYSK